MAETIHTEANTFKCTAERVMKHLASKLFKTVEKRKRKAKPHIFSDTKQSI